MFDALHLRHASARLVLLVASLVVVTADAAAQCVRVGGNVGAPVKILHVDPVYPPAAAAARVQGIVILELTIEAGGTVSSSRVLRSIPLLDAAAVTAVNQWRYEVLPSGIPCLLYIVTVTFTLPTDTTAPSNLQASVNGHLITLSWQPPTVAVTAYLVEAGTGPGLSNIASQPLPASPPALSVPVPDGTYFIRVRAARPSGTSAPSNEVIVVVGCSQPPPAPDAFAMAQGPGGNPVQFSWAAPAVPVDAFQLEAGSASGLADLTRLTLPGSATTFSVNAPPGIYHVRLRAMNACGPSAPSQDVIVAVGATCTPPSAPQNLQASVNGQVVTLGWAPPAAGTPPVTYTLLAGSSPGASNLAVVSMGTQTSLQASVPNGTYYVRVVATNACGTSTASTEATVVVGGSTGTPQLTFSVTPNPVPFTGVFPGCAGSPVANKTWLYTLRIANQGTGSFVIGSFSATVTSPLLPGPVVVPYTPDLFTLAFGGSTIPPNGALQGLLCVAGNFDSATLTWTFVDTGGASFTAPTIYFLPSPF
jgi:TonB family protein